MTENSDLYWHSFFTLSTVSIYVCVVVITGSYIFYKLKLAAPLKALMEGIEQIAVDNLDFSVHYDAEDELGTLCRSFERMRNCRQESLIDAKNLQVTVIKGLKQKCRTEKS